MRKKNHKNHNNKSHLICLYKFTFGFMEPLYFILIICLIYSCNNITKNKQKESQSRFEKINGCEKEVSNKIFDVNGKDSLAWEKSYSDADNQTCDFTAYIVKNKKYKDGILVEKNQYVAGCDECEETPCGTWIYFDSDGKKIKTQEYSACDIKQFE